MQAPKFQRLLPTNLALATTLIMATIEVVQIYLPIQVGSTRVTTERIQVAPTTEWIHALSIPHRDIERLTFRPLKWLRFATFTVCGAKGDLSATQRGEIVDYDNVSFENLADKYYYTPNGNLMLPALSISSNDASRKAYTTSLTTRHSMTGVHQLQLVDKASTSVRIFADAMTVALSRGTDVQFAMRRILYPTAKAARYVHLISASPRRCLPFP